MFEILRCGPLTTVQDQGRHGLAHLGISNGGCLDPNAMRQVNLLLGNPPDAAVIEILHAPLLLSFTVDCDIALGGDDLDAALLDDRQRLLERGTVWPGRVVRMRAGRILRLSGRQTGRYAVLGVAGGIDVPRVLGSRSTDVTSAFGGLEGCPLQAGDRLSRRSAEDRGLRVFHGIRPLPTDNTLRCIPGPEFDCFSHQSCQDLFQLSWRVTPQSNRMAVSLSGTPLRGTDQGMLPSSPVVPGVIQVPPDGQPVILSRDAQTIGGYPRIATVITADLWKLAYLKAGTRVHLQSVSINEADTALLEWQRYWARLETNCGGARD